MIVPLSEPLEGTHLLQKINDCWKGYTNYTMTSCILSDLYGHILIPSSELNQFIKDDYKTKEELYQEQLIKQQEKSMSFTRKIAYLSLALSVLSFLASLFLASNRKVEITNPGAFSNQMKVIIEKDSTQQKK